MNHSLGTHHRPRSGRRAVAAVRLAAAALFAAWALASTAFGQLAPPPPDHACRFWGMIGTAPDDSVLYDQLVSGTHALMKLASSNRDGWGIAYWAEGLSGTNLTRPQILRAGPPANHEYDMRYRLAAAELGQQDAHCAVVHLRAASSGHGNGPDPHPFVRGDFCLAHNGTVNPTVMLALLDEGTPGYLEKHPTDYELPYVDSELFFLYVLKQLEEGDGHGGRSLWYSDAICDAALRMYDAGAPTTSINSVMACGDTLYALRFDNSNDARYRLKYKQIPGGWTVASQAVGTDTTGWSVIPPKTLAIFTPVDPPRFITVFPPPTGWLALQEIKLDDDAFGQSQGNGDGVPNGGETIEVEPILLNAGGTTATQIWGVLSPTDTLCAALDSVNFYPTLLPDQNASPLSPFVLRVNPGAPTHFTATFSLEVHAQVEPAGDPLPVVWTRTFTLTGRSASLSCPLSIVADTGGGGLDPGEDGTLCASIANQGAVGATGIEGQLVALSNYLEILQPLAGIDTLAIGAVEQLAPPFELRVSPQTPDPEILYADLVVTADWGMAKRIKLEIPVGGFFDPLEGGPGAWTHASGIAGYSDAWHLSMLRNHTPGGSTSWKCGSPDSGMAYDNLIDAVLESPVIPLAQHAQLRFWHYIQAELAGAHFGVARDGGLVEASINGGPWTQLYPATGYDFLIGESRPPGPFPPQTPVFSGYWPWRESVFEIDGYEGTVQFRFRFGSDGSTEAETVEGWYVDDVRVLGTNTTTGVETEIDLPLRPGLSVGGPNPFRDQTLILYDVALDGEIELSILDLEGRVVRTLVRDQRPSGRHRVTWDGRDNSGRPVPSGLYFYRLESRSDAFEQVRRVIRVR